MKSPSSDPFNFASSSAVAPIPCVRCGNNMHCIRRTLSAAGEHQQFMCMCGNAVERTVGLLPSDATIQSEVETSLGIRPGKM